MKKDTFQMIGFRSLLLTISVALSSTAAIADSGTQAVVRMVILGTSAGGEGFITRAISVSGGVGDAVMAGYVADADAGAIGTAVVTGKTEDSISNSLVGFTSSYETLVCMTESCPVSIVN